MKKVITTIISIILVCAVLAFLFAPVFNSCRDNSKLNDKDMIENLRTLVVVDVQNDFIDGSLRNEEAIARIPNIVDYINKYDGDVIYVTQDTHGENYLDTPEGKKLPVVHCVLGTPGWQINDDVFKALMDAQERGILVSFIQKPTFGSYELIDTLRDLYADKYPKNWNIDFLGFCTDICVVSNVLLTKAAFYNDANIGVIENCCAGVTPESHQAALNTMQMCQIDIK